MALRTGVDPAASRSTGGRSTVELPKHVFSSLEVRAGIEPAIHGLQPLAFPLDYLTIVLVVVGGERRIRTPRPYERHEFSRLGADPSAALSESPSFARPTTSILVADLGTAPSHPAYETGVVSSRPPRVARSRTPGRRFSPALLAKTPDGFVSVARPSQPRGAMLAGREGVEPSRASFGDSPDPAIPTYVGAIGGSRTRTAALVARRSSARRPIASAAPERFERSSLRLTSARTAEVVLQGTMVEVQGIEP